MLIEVVALMTVVWVAILHRYLGPARVAMRNRDEKASTYSGY